MGLLNNNGILTVNPKKFAVYEDYYSENECSTTILIKNPFKYPITCKLTFLSLFPLCISVDDTEHNYGEYTREVEVPPGEERVTQVFLKHESIVNDDIPGVVTVTFLKKTLFGESEVTLTEQLNIFTR